MSSPRRILLSTPAGRLVAGANVLLVIAVAVALAALWPREDAAGRPPSSLADAVRADVESITPGGCEDYAGPNCSVVAVRLVEGPNRGRRSFVTLSDDRFTPDFDAGDRIRVTRSRTDATRPERPGGDDLERPEAQPYAFVDFERRTPLTVLAVVFGALVVALGRWQGLRALAGLGVSLVVVVLFVAPAILEGRPPLLIALIGGLAVMAATMGLTHGIGLKSQAALLGTTLALVLIAVLGTVAVDAAQITGLSEETALLLSGSGGRAVSLQGLVLAGLVIGALGVLDDVTISQASTVLALRRVNPELSTRRLYDEALAVGRDHLGATVNTLVLAYAGAALPVLLIFSYQGVGFAGAVNFESVAAEVVATLVGSIGLIAAVPLTTALAATLAVRLPAEALPADAGHAHAH